MPTLLKTRLCTPPLRHRPQLINGAELTEADCQCLELLDLSGSPILISFQPALTSYQGKLLSNSRKGTPVHAASFLRRRTIVLESSLLDDGDLRRLILMHEVFHFVWLRLGNQRRRNFSDLLDYELAAGARGELGESASVKKTSLNRHSLGSWREYVCESFCDTNAWLYAGVAQHESFTLAARWRKRRRIWVELNMVGEIRC